MTPTTISSSVALPVVAHGTPTVVVVSGTTYYQCDSAWYVRVYNGGEVAYTMVNPPAGY